jgi:hypothetical protein
MCFVDLHGSQDHLGIGTHDLDHPISCWYKKHRHIYEALIMLSSINKKGEIASASRPTCGFWCLNDKTIKELMSFAKCEIGKMSCDYIEAIHSSRHMSLPISFHTLNVIKTRRISSSEKEENELMMYAPCILLS